MDSILVDWNEVFVFLQKDSKDFWLPQLEAFMPKQESLLLICGDVQYNDAVSIDVNGLVRHNKLSTVGTPVINCNVGILNV